MCDEHGSISVHNSIWLCLTPYHFIDLKHHNFNDK